MFFYSCSDINFKSVQPTRLLQKLEKYKNNFAPVVPFSPEKDKLLQLDFTGADKNITNTILADTPAFSGYINQLLLKAGARYGIGGYGEHRTIYSQSHVFDGSDPNEEPRRLHLGTDIWGKPHTAVMTPIDGIVHSFAFNDRFGDYGVTIILSHVLDNISFHTLYGHLSLNSIKNLNGGEKIYKADVFAEFGIPSENGHWPPHLHFQLIAEIGEWKGDYPGVCKFSEKEKWLSNSPDPDLILQLSQFI
ncbi:MAG: peptidoglycan DD-metalloendopeptidase family protein [Sphingobacteriales bacterium]|nr:peptidoglycan DD-metalloendopeptidase family protein [Sphingobacteriales bacterium]